MLAEVATRVGRNDDARKLLERCLELAPGFAAARYNYAVVLHRSNDPAEALVQVLRLLKADPRNPSYRNLHAVVLSYVGEYERALEIYAKLVREYPAHAKVWLSYGHVLKTDGRQDRRRRRLPAEHRLRSGFRRGVLEPRQSQDLPLHRGGPCGDARPARPPRSSTTRVACNFHFALGKAYEDGADYAQAFEHYSKGNALYRASHRYDADRNSARVKRLKEILTRDFFEERAGWGCQAPDPIFIVSMPRAGSTLLEQILSSHSAVEGTSELPAVLTLAKELREEADAEETIAYAEVLAKKSAGELRLLGEQYMERTRIQRKTGRPFFIDKMPNNFLHVGMIHAVLPNAKIIDARRHPLACCFSNFKQHYARGQRFSYDLTDMGRYYRDYVGTAWRTSTRPCPAASTASSTSSMVEDTEIGSPSPARLLRTAVRGRLPALLRERASRPDRQLRAGPPAHLPRRDRSVAPFRGVARSTQGRARTRSLPPTRRSPSSDLRSLRLPACAAVSLTRLTALSFAL